jgi:ABC-type Fe3+/spermidine/putrescine transport system ATPase subunit
MALSDRIALLKNGALEQVASPREIYAHPASSYTAEFIGQTNLLRSQIRNGVAAWGPLQWSATQPAGAALFSLRPEAIHLSPDGLAPPDAVRFRAMVRQQIFSGSSEHLELELAGQSLRARIPARGPLSGDQEFWFSPADAVAVRE